MFLYTDRIIVEGWFLLRQTLSLTVVFLPIVERKTAALSFSSSI